MPCPARFRYTRGFNTRSPCGGATYHILHFHDVLLFQHTLPVRGSDFKDYLEEQELAQFQHTLPVRGSDICHILSSLRLQFQHTLPVRGSDRNTHKWVFSYSVSTHAPRAGERLDIILSLSIFSNSFNTRSPCGGATRGPRYACAPHSSFNTRSPCGGATCSSSCADTYRLRFQHTLPVRGSDLSGSKAWRRREAFQHTLPVRGSDAIGRGQSPRGLSFNTRSPCGGATYSVKVPLFIDTSKGISRTSIRESFLNR